MSEDTFLKFTVGGQQYMYFVPQQQEQELQKCIEEVKKRYYASQDDKKDSDPNRVLMMLLLEAISELRSLQKTSEKENTSAGSVGRPASHVQDREAPALLEEELLVHKENFKALDGRLDDLDARLLRLSRAFKASDSKTA